MALIDVEPLSVASVNDHVEEIYLLPRLFCERGIQFHVFELLHFVICLSQMIDLT